MSIRLRLISFGLISLLAAVLLGGLGFSGQLSLSSAIDDSGVTVSALRNHLEGDMMHDGLRADVLAALHARGNSTQLAQVKSDFQEHADWFRRTLRDNSQLDLPDAVKAAIRESQPALETYIREAERIVTLAETDLAAADAALPAFETAFTALEEKNEKLSELIEVAVKAAADHAETATRRSAWLLGIGFVAVLIVLGLLLRGILQAVLKPLADVVHDAQTLAAGDLRNMKHSSQRNDETGQLLDAMRQLQAQLRQMLGEMNSESARLTQSAGHLRHTSGAVVSRATEQASAAQHMSQVIADMIETLQQIARHAQQAESLSTQSEQLAREGGSVILGVLEGMNNIAQAVRESSSTIETLGKESEEIISIIQVISGIADQTNLLALNAAIEAARAGEAGRGFAVVADEVRGLAARTAQSTREITAMIQRIQHSTQNAVQSMQVGVSRVDEGVARAQQAGDAINQIRSGAAQAAKVVGEIAHSIDSQSRTSADIAQQVRAIAARAREAADAIQDISNTAGELEAVAGDLQQTTAKFSV